MATIKEVIEERGNEVADIEIYKFTGCRHDIHNDFIKSVDVSHNSEIEIYDYEIMDEEDYERTVLANVDLFADFEEWYGDKNAKVLVIMLDEFTEVE